MPNVFVVGQTGCGKSSVVNLIAGETLAPTPLGEDLGHFTKHCTGYPILVSGNQFQIFDTFGFLEPDLDDKLYAEAIANTYGMIKASGGVDMLLYCVRGDKTSTHELQKMKNHYRLLHEVLCDEEVPIALVVTGRSGSGLNAEHYKSIFITRNIAFVDCICANIASNGEPVDNTSQEAVRKLLVKCCEAPESRSTLQQIWRVAKGLVGRGQSLKEKKVSTLLTGRCNMKPATAELVVAALKPQLSSNRLHRAPYARGKCWFLISCSLALTNRWVIVAVTPESPPLTVTTPKEQEPAALASQ